MEAGVVKCAAFWNAVEAVAVVGLFLLLPVWLPILAVEALRLRLRMPR